jgi:hypothetical protein
LTLIAVLDFGSIIQRRGARGERNPFLLPRRFT